MSRKKQDISPELAAEWHPNKNGDLLPQHFSRGSGHKAWWLCPKNELHEYQATINNRSQGKGCPYCSGQKVHESDSLANLNKKLAAEWHPTKNKNLTPKLVTMGSGKKVWWQCANGDDHVWQAPVYSRAGGNGCPYCAGHLPDKSNNLEKKFPDISAAWNFSKNGRKLPSEFLPYSNSKVWWQCSVDKTHIWKASINSRTSNGTGCPYCSNRSVHKGNNLEVLFPDIAAQWHPTLNKVQPREVVAKSRQVAWWVCPNDPRHVYEARIDHRTIANSDCPFCAGQKVNETNSLAALYPHIAKSWHPNKNGKLTPHDITPKSTAQKIWWQCERSKEHEWQATASDRVRGNHGCPYCSNNRSAPELRIYSELQCIFPDATNRFKIDGIEIDLYLPQAKIGIEYDGSYWHKGKLDKDKKKNAELNERGIFLIRVRETPLTKISTQDVLVGDKGLSKLDLDKIVKKIDEQSDLFAREIQNYLTESDFVNQKKYQEYLSFLPNPIPERSLAASHPELSKIWDYAKNAPLTPKNFTSGSNKNVFWLCEKDHRHSHKQPISYKAKHGVGCPFCSGRKVHCTTSLLATEPEIASQWDMIKNGDLTPEHVTRKSNKTVWWRCTINASHSWKTSIANRTNGTGCPICVGRFCEPADSLLILFPDIASEWHQTKNRDLLPIYIKPNSSRKVWWSCSSHKGHEWLDRVSNRVIGSTCPFCQQ
jgi:hypothetical protein